jgi:uncharacterized protein (TIGR00730 family)
MAAQGIRLVYGGGDVGLMGTVARAVLDGGGAITGIIPRFLQRREQMLGAVEDLIVTADMHERKRLMFERADAFVALPGGVGTLEELVEQMTWVQLGQHKKPIVVVNIDGFWNGLNALIDHMRAQGFIRAEFAVHYLEVDSAEAVIPTIREALASVSRRDLGMAVSPDVL